MTYVLEPLVAGELGDGTQLDATTHPPLVRHVEFVLDLPTDEDLIESFPVFLVSESLGHALASANLTGFWFDDADVRPSTEYLAAYGAVSHKRYRWLRPQCRPHSSDCWLDERHRLCVSDRMYAVLSQHRIDGCAVTIAADGMP